MTINPKDFETIDKVININSNATMTRLKGNSQLKITSAAVKLHRGQFQRTLIAMVEIYTVASFPSLVILTCKIQQENVK